MAKRDWFILIGTCVLLGGFLAAPIRLPHTVEVPGRILCAREWIVRMETGGVIVAMLVDRKAGTVSNSTVHEYSRGDVVQLEFSPEARSGATVCRGDTLVQIHSNEIARALAELEGQVASAEASLVTSSTGQKAAIVEGAREQLEQARRNNEALDVILARQKLLYEKGMVSEQEYELAQRQAAVASIGVSIAGANLHAVSTGEKQEQRDLMRANILRLSGELEVVRKRQAECALRAPFKGVVLCSGVSDTLLMVADTTEYVVLMPVPLKEYGCIAAQQRVCLSGQEPVGIVPGIITGVVSPVEVYGGQQVVMITGQCIGRWGTVMHGSVARCVIECAPWSPIAYVQSLVTRSLH
jgi:hypothetical protein